MYRVGDIVKIRYGTVPKEYEGSIQEISSIREKDSEHLYDGLVYYEMKGLPKFSKSGSRCLWSDFELEKYEVEDMRFDEALVKALDGYKLRPIVKGIERGYMYWCRYKLMYIYVDESGQKSILTNMRKFEKWRVCDIEPKYEVGQFVCNSEGDIGRVMYIKKGVECRYGVCFSMISLDVVEYYDENEIELVV